MFRRFLNNVVKPINSDHHLIKATIKNILIGALYGELICLTACLNDGVDRKIQAYTFNPKASFYFNTQRSTSAQWAFFGTLAMVWALVNNIHSWFHVISHI